MSVSTWPNIAPEILFVTHTAAAGGAELTLMNYLEKSDLENVTVATLQPGGVWSQLRSNIRLLELNVRTPVRATSALSSVLHHRMPALVVANTMRSALYCAFATPRQVPLAYWVHDGLGPSSAMSRGALTATRLVTLKRADHYLTNSHWTAETLLDWLPHADPVTVAPPCGISRGELSVRAPKEPLATGPFRLLYLGRIAEWKAPDVAIEAVRGLNESAGKQVVTLTLAGDAQFEGDRTYDANVRALAADLGNSVQMVGHVSDISPLFETHHALVHCSTTPEPFGRVIAEALSRGMPVIATNAGAPARMIDSSVNGFLYRPGDVGDLMKKVEQLRKSNLTEYSSACLKAAELYCDDILIPQIDSSLLQWAGTGRSR